MSVFGFGFFGGMGGRLRNVIMLVFLSFTIIF